MKLNLDPVFTMLSSVDPEPITLSIADATYTVRLLNDADVRSLSDIGSNGDQQCFDDIKALFVGDAPPAIDQLAALAKDDIAARRPLLDQITVILFAIRAATSQQTTKKLRTAADMLQSQAETAAASARS